MVEILGDRADRYDPFAPGAFPVGVRTFEAHDKSRDRRFPCDVWYPAVARDAAARPGTHPLVVYSHQVGGGRRSATFLCTHLSSHGYVVAALDHSEVVAPELQRGDGESGEQTDARIAGWIANRVPDVQFLLDEVLDGAPEHGYADPDPTRIGIVGHSFGGWTALATPSDDGRVASVVALAPAGSSIRRPGIIPVTLTFEWGRPVPTLFLVAAQDTLLPLDGMRELFERTPSPRRMVLLHGADHQHFVDHIEREHEALRAIPATAEVPWPEEIRPFAELCPADEAHTFVRGLTLAHLDSTLRQDEQASRLLSEDLETELARRGVHSSVHRP
jgi:predicted dienelactone hydrolase